MFWQPILIPVMTERLKYIFICFVFYTEKLFCCILRTMKIDDVKFGGKNLMNNFDLHNIVNLINNESL